MWMEYPDLEELYHVDDQYLVGSDLLVKPVVHPGVTEIEVQFPADHIWYDVDTMSKMPVGDGIVKVVPLTVSSGIDKIPVYQRGGSIIPRKLRLRRSTQMMSDDPYTIYIALDSAQKAFGEIYMDDEDSFDHERKGSFAKANLSANISTSIRCEVEGSGEWIESQPEGVKHIERVVIMGLGKAPKKLFVDSVELEFNYDAKNQVLVIPTRKSISALKDWEIFIE